MEKRDELGMVPVAEREFQRGRCVGEKMAKYLRRKESLKAAINGYFLMKVERSYEAGVLYALLEKFLRLGGRLVIGEEKG